MKKLILILILTAISVPAMAQEHSHSHDSWLKPVEAQYVCMVNNQSYDSPQIAVEVEGKTYFGCCPMCKDRLAKDPAIRSAVDPVSGNTVNKAEAVIGTGPDKMVYYFESEENFHKFSSGPMPESREHSAMEGMKDSMMDSDMHRRMNKMNGHDDVKEEPETHEGRH